VRVGVTNVLGQVFVDWTPVSPFGVVDRAVSGLEALGADLVLVDAHAEATSEKQALGYHRRVGRRPWSELKNTHAHRPQASELRFRALLTEDCSELELIGT